MQWNLKRPPKPTKRPVAQPSLKNDRKKTSAISIKRSKSSDKGISNAQMISKNSESNKVSLSPTTSRKVSENYIEIDTCSVPKHAVENNLVKPYQKRTKSEQKLNKANQLTKTSNEKSQIKEKKHDKTKTKDNEIKKFNKDIRELRTLFGRKSRYFKCERDFKKAKDCLKSSTAKTKRNQEIHKKRAVSSLKKVDKKKKKEIQIKSAVKIQAYFRGYLTRKTIKQFLKNSETHKARKENHNSTAKENHEVSLTLFSCIKDSLNAFQNPLELSTPSFYSQTISKDSISEEISQLAKQKEQLKNLEKEDMKLIQEVMKNFQLNTSAIELFNKLIERRYTKIYSYFDDWILKLKMSLKYLIRIKNSNDSTIKDYLSTEKRLKNSEALCHEIEKIWQQIDKLKSKTQVFETASIKPDHFSINLNDLSKQLLDDKAGEQVDDIEVIQFLPVPQSCSKDLASDQISSVEIKISFSFLEFNQGSSSISLENSKALKDYSSIKIAVEAEQLNDTSSLQKDLELKPRFSTRQILWPSGSRSIFERDSPSNPLSVTNNSEKIYDISGENLVVDRVIFILEILIYNDLIDDHLALFDDINFTVKITENYLSKIISCFIKEALRPRVLRQSTNPSVMTDTQSLLKGIDLIFIKILQKPEKFKARLQHLFGYEKFWIGLRSGNKNWHGDCEIIQKGNRKIDAFSEVHEKCIIDALTELFIRKVEREKSGIYDIITWKIHGLKLADILVNIRNKLADWNDIKAGNLPFGETIRPNGDLDESKLFIKRKQSLNNMILDEIDEQEDDWVDYIFEEEQVLEKLDKDIMSILFDEIINIC